MRLCESGSDQDLWSKLDSGSSAKTNPPHVDAGEIYRLTIMIGQCENLCIIGLIFGGRLNREVPMAAIAPPLAIILIVALIFYLARRSAYKQRK